MEPGSTSPFGGAEIIVADRRWRRHVRHLPLIVRRALAAAGCGADVVLTDDRTVKRLNYRDRGKNKPTNVLTYANPPEMLLAFGVVAREAARESKSIAQHLRTFWCMARCICTATTITTPARRGEMEAEEARILSRLRVPNPWKNR